MSSDVSKFVLRFPLKNETFQKPEVVAELGKVFPPCEGDFPFPEDKWDRPFWIIPNPHLEEDGSFASKLRVFTKLVPHSSEDRWALEVVLSNYVAFYMKGPEGLQPDLCWGSPLNPQLVADVQRTLARLLPKAGYELNLLNPLVCAYTYYNGTDEPVFF